MQEQSILLNPLLKILQDPLLVTNLMKFHSCYKSPHLKTVAIREALHIIEGGTFKWEQGQNQSTKRVETWRVQGTMGIPRLSAIPAPTRYSAFSTRL